VRHDDRVRTRHADRPEAAVDDEAHGDDDRRADGDGPGDREQAPYAEVFHAARFSGS